MGCVSQDSYPRKSIPREQGKLGSKHTVKFSKGTRHQIKIRERKGPSRGIIPKCAPNERSPCTQKFGERSHEETLHQERCARRVAWNLAKQIYMLKNADNASFHTPLEARVVPAPTSKRPDEREFAVDSGASMCMLSKKNSSSVEMDTVKRSRTPAVVLTANGEVQAHEEAQVIVHDLFVTVHLLDETLADLSLGKLCEDHGYSYEWVQRSKTTVDQNGQLRTSCCSMLPPTPVWRERGEGERWLLSSHPPLLPPPATTTFTTPKPQTSLGFG